MPDRDVLLRRAMEAHQRGQLALAEATYRRVLRRWPRDPDAQHFLGVLRFRQGDSAGAIEQVRASLASDPSNPHAWMNLGNILMASDEVTGACEAYCRATELEPGLADAWYNLGICHRRREAPREAIEALRQALELRPAHAESRYQLGIALKQLGNLDQAIDEMSRALALAPDSVKVHRSLGVLLYRQGRIEEAADVYRAWLKHEPDSPIARHMLAATGAAEAPARASDAFIVQVFDQFAETFDTNLDLLGYQAPQLVTDALIRASGAATDLDLLDAGCGTGLCGPLIAPIKRRLAGVDISPGMIARARARGVYDELAVAELCQFMVAHPRQYDAVVSADTLVYFGDLVPPLEAARLALRENGLLVFTVERQGDEESDAGFRLEPHGRYVHTRSYVGRALEAGGLRLRSMEEAVLRQECGRDVMGLVTVASLG